MRILISILHLILALALLSCEKESTENNSDPQNLMVEIVSINYLTAEVQINSSATNAVQYEMYVDAANTPVLTNTTGQFTYTFLEVNNYTVTIRAYGSSGRYLKKTIEVIFLDEVPLDSGYISPISYDNYELIWSDEFNGNSINSTDWTFEIGNGDWGWGNNELEYYRAENASVKEGTLIIEARKENYEGFQYTSTRMITKNKQSFQYGRIDIRAILPEGQGMWPALWMLGENISTVGWPACGEIDIMEMIGGQGRENTVHGTLHWESDGHASSGAGNTLSSGTYANKYHVFSIIWNSNSIRWFVDNKQYHILDITPDHMSEFHNKFFFIFNVAVGGNWPGSPDATTNFPQQMKVDYIRVFQKN